MQEADILSQTSTIVEQRVKNYQFVDELLRIRDEKPDLYHDLLWLMEPAESTELKNFVSDLLSVPETAVSPETKQLSQLRLDLNRL